MIRKLVRGAGYALYLAVFAEAALQGFYWLNAGQPLWRRTALPIFAADPVTGFWNKRDLDVWQRTNEYASRIITNADGLRVAARGVEYRPGRDPSRYRVLLLGPSFAFGWGVDYAQSFGHVLETRLNGAGFAAGRRVEVINAGVPFMSARQSLDWYERRGSRYAPDLVLLLTYGSLDIADDYGSERVTVDADGYLVPRDPAGSGWRGIARRSALAFYAWIAYGRLQAWRAGGAARPIEGAGRALSTHAAFSAEGHEVAPSLEVYRRGRALAAGGGAPFLVVDLPAAYVVHREDVARWQGIGVNDIDALIDYDRRFCDYLNAEQVSCVDVTPDLVGAARPDRRLYYWVDVHWTAEGNAVAAAAVARRLLADAALRTR